MTKKADVTQVTASHDAVSSELSHLSANPVYKKLFIWEIADLLKLFSSNS